MFLNWNSPFYIYTILYIYNIIEVHTYGKQNRIFQNIQFACTSQFENALWFMFALSQESFSYYMVL